MKADRCKYFSVLFILLFALLGCKKKAEDIVYRDLSFDPLIILDQIPSGLSQSDDPYAKLVYDDIVFMADWGEFSGQLSLPASAIKLTSGDAETYKWNLGTGSLLLLINLSFSKEGDGYQWQEQIQYGPVGNLSEYLTAQEDESGKNGSLEYNTLWFCGIEQLTDPCDPLYRNYEWELGDDGSIAYFVKMKDQTVTPELNLEYRLILASGGAGTINAYSGTEQYYQAAWNNLGNGVYTRVEGETPETHEW